MTISYNTRKSQFYLTAAGKEFMIGLQRSDREKRKHKRVGRRFIVNMQVAEAHPKHWQIVDLENISEGGILFNHNEKIKPKSVLNFKIKISSDRDAIRCSGQVMHVTQLGETGLYEYGIQFKKLQPEDQVFLRQALEG